MRTHARMLERYADEIMNYLRPEHRPKLVPFTIDAAAALFYADPKEVWQAGDMISLVPPYEVTWMEYNFPRYSNDEGQRIRLPIELLPRAGCLLTVAEFEKAEWEDVLRQDPIWLWLLQSATNARQRQEYEAHSAERQSLLAKAREQGESARWFAAYTLFHDLMGQRLSSVVTNLCYLNPQGRYVPGSAYTQSDLKDEKAIHQANGNLMAFLFTTSLLSCRNVHVKEGERVPEPVARKRRENAQRHGQDYRPVQFKTLDIDVMTAAVKRAGGPKAGGGAVQVSFHEVRGGFRTYDENNRLFGKWTGTWYWHPYNRGTLKRGVVVKDYRA